MKTAICTFLLILLANSLLGCVNTSNLSNSISSHPSAQHCNQSVPAEYAEVISDYEKIVDFRLSSTFEEDYNNGRFVELKGKWATNIWGGNEGELQENCTNYRWHCTIIDMIDWIDTPSKTSFGYMLLDVDNNGIPELFWVSSNYEIFAIFTMVDNEAVLVDTFSQKHYGSVLNSGEICTRDSVNAQEYRYTIARIDSSTGVLGILIRFGKESDLYYKENDGIRCTISKDEYIKLYERYSTTVRETSERFFCPLGG